MSKEKLTLEETRLARMFKSEILAGVPSLSPDILKQEQFSNNIEYISQTNKQAEEKPYVSPIFSMSEEELIAFVEEFEVGELATLSFEELNHIGNVLGVDPNDLAG